MREKKTSGEETLPWRNKKYFRKILPASINTDS